MRSNDSLEGLPKWSSNRLQREHRMLNAFRVLNSRGWKSVNRGHVITEPLDISDHRLGI